MFEAPSSHPKDSAADGGRQYQGDLVTYQEPRNLPTLCG